MVVGLSANQQNEEPFMTASSLPCRLICASNLAYQVSTNGPLTPSPLPDYAAGAGLIGKAVGFIDSLAVHACLVGTFQDGVFISFRGTLAIDDPNHSLQLRIRDWVNDFRARLVESPNIPGKVHEGFLDGLNSLWDGAKKEAERQLALLGAGSKLFITGHSKGGGIAPLAAVRWFQETGTKPTTITFEAPKVGNEDFQSGVATAGLEIHRYEYQDDFVPHVPPSSRLLTMLQSFIGEDFSVLDDHNYQHVGQLHFIDSNNVIRTPTNVVEEFLLNSERLTSIARLILGKKLDQIIEDHRIGCGSGAMKIVCSGEVCK